MLAGEYKVEVVLQAQSRLALSPAVFIVVVAILAMDNMVSAIW